MPNAKKQNVILKTVILERVRVSFPATGLTIPQALQAGILLGGSELAARIDLRMLAREQMLECGVDFEKVSPRGSVTAGMRIIPRAALPVVPGPAEPKSRERLKSHPWKLGRATPIPNARG